MTLNWDSNAQPLKDSAGNSIHMMDGMGFSPNGKWMIIEAYELGILRINTETHEKQLISPKHFRYGQGIRPSMTLAISNDGNSAIVSGKNAVTEVFDLTECQPTPFMVGSDDNTTPGCRSRVVREDLLEQLSGFIGFYDMRYNYDGKLVRAIAHRTNPTTGNIEKLNVTYSIAGYQPVDTEYLALGDSFSSGEGAYNYERGTDEPQNKCHLSRDSYPYLTTSALAITDFHSTACSGARLEDYYAPQDDRHNNPNNSLGVWLPGYKAQQAYAKQSGEAQAITISLGGNNIGFGEKLRECVTSLGTCKYAGDSQERSMVAAEIASQFRSMKAMYSQLAFDTNNKTKIYAVGYPQITGGELQCDSNVHLNGDEVEFARQATRYLNQVIEAAADAAGVYYLDLEDSLSGSNLCSGVNRPSQSVNGLTAGDDIDDLNWWQKLGAKIITGSTSFGNESYHPNKLGHQKMMLSISSTTNGNLLSRDTCPEESDDSVICPKSNIKIPAPDETYFGSKSGDYVRWINNPDINALPLAERTAPSNQRLIADSQGNRQARVNVESKLKPGSTAKIQLSSETVDIGEYIADDNGTIDVVVTVPDTVPAGRHTLHFFGEDIAGEPIHYYQPAIVTGDEGDIDQDGVPDDEDPCGFVEASNKDEDFDGADDACDAQITEPVDTVPPEVTGTPERQPDSGGWYNHEVTINWAAVDPEPSSGEPSQPETTIANQEGVHTYTSDESCDSADNCAAGSLEVKLDKTAPVLGDATWSNNPKSPSGSSTMTLDVNDQLSGLAYAEYFIGEDPGKGNGTALSVNQNQLAATFGPETPSGIHEITIRAKDEAGNWSDPMTEHLVVNSPAQTGILGYAILQPSLSNGDSLPGLDSNDQTDKARISLNVRYDQNGDIHDSSKLTLNYTVTECRKISLPTILGFLRSFLSRIVCGFFGNHQVTQLETTSINWLTTPDDKTGIFHGTGELTSGATTEQVAFKLTGVDGKHSDTDKLTLEIFSPDDNIFTPDTLYRVSAELDHGNISVRTP